MYLAIDYGKKRIGLALGSIFPRGAGIIDGSKSRPFIFDEIKRIALENEVEGIVVGLPIRKNGEVGTLDSEIKEFAEKLQEVLQLPIYFEPEELTSAEAERKMAEQGIRPDKKSGKTDEMAAILILEQFLNSKNARSK